MTSAIIILLFLFLVNGLFVMAEVALISARKTRLEVDARKGDSRALSAVENANAPTKILSTIQIAITLIGILTGVFSSNEIATYFDSLLQLMGMTAGISHSLALAIVVVIVTFISMLIGELVPKRIGLTNPEGIIKYLVHPLIAISYVTYPFTWLLTRAGDGIIHLLRIKPSEDSKVTEEEIKAMVQEGTDHGEVQEIEQDIVARVFHLGDRKISSLMTHHSDLIWLDATDSLAQMQEKMKEAIHSVYPVCEGDLDNVVGVIFIKDFFLEVICKEDSRVSERIRPAQFILETLTAYETLEIFKQNKIHYGLVVDEYGSTVGMVTLNDILEALVGDFNEPSPDEPGITVRDDGSWLVDGSLSFYEFAYELNIQGFDKNKIKFDTVAGLAMNNLKHIPDPGEKFSWLNYDFEVVDLDGNRIDKLIIKKSGT